MHPAMIAARVAFGVLLVLTYMTPASARDAGYVSGSVFADIREFSNTSGVPFYGDQFSLDATAIGGGLRIGTFLHPRWSLELSAETASKTTVDLDDAVRILIFPPPRFDFRASAKFQTVTTSVAFHPPAVGRVRLGYRGGFSFVRGTYRSDYPGYPGFPFPTAIFTLESVGSTLPTIVSPPQFITRTV